MSGNVIPEKKKMIEAAVRTGVFRDKEIDVLEELIDEMLSGKETTYRVLSSDSGGELTAFVIFGRTPLTDLSWDIYWLVVPPEHQGKGLGRKILSDAERIMTEENSEAVIRVETSTREEYAPARRFYAARGFREVGVIEDFYSRGDGLAIYAKNVDQGKGGKCKIKNEEKT
ncbi:MAG: N-acetyltransferase [Candidatus Omnitrophota bacterium]